MYTTEYLYLQFYRFKNYKCDLCGICSLYEVWKSANSLRYISHEFECLLNLIKIHLIVLIILGKECILWSP